jgi:hypothetical protein
MASESRMSSEELILKDAEGSRLDLIWGTLPEFTEGTEEIHKNPQSRESVTW